MQAKVLPPLALNSTNCKHARDYVKELNAARDKQSLKQKALDKLKTKDAKNKGKIVSLTLQLGCCCYAAARLLMSCKKYDHITPVLINLHWLPVRYRINFKIYYLLSKPSMAWHLATSLI